MAIDGTNTDHLSGLREMFKGQPTLYEIFQANIENYPDRPFTGLMSEINRVPRLTNAEIIASATVHNPERLRYEVEEKTRCDSYFEKTYWSNGVVQANICSEYVFYCNSEGKEIASFNLKA